MASICRFSEECGKDVPVGLIDMHSCSLDSKIKMSLGICAWLLFVIPLYACLVSLYRLPLVFVALNDILCTLPKTEAQVVDNVATARKSSEK